MADFASLADVTAEKLRAVYEGDYKGPFARHFRFNLDRFWDTPKTRKWRKGDSLLLTSEMLSW